MIRSERICFRLTKEEFDYIEKQAEEEGLTKSEYVHEAVKKEIKRATGA
jgi:predicted DNA-binding protein